MTREIFEKLKEIEKDLHTAVYSGYCNYLSDSKINTVEMAYAEIANYKHFKIKRNCSHCVIKAFQQVGVIYFNTKPRMLEENKEEERKKEIPLLIQKEKEIIEQTEKEIEKKLNSNNTKGLGGLRIKLGLAKSRLNKLLQDIDNK